MKEQYGMIFKFMLVTKGFKQLVRSINRVPIHEHKPNTITRISHIVESGEASGKKFGAIQYRHPNRYEWIVIILH